MRLQIGALALSVVVPLTGCGEDDTGGVGFGTNGPTFFDAGAGSDAGAVPVDAATGLGSDASTLGDASTQDDASVGTDASAGNDAGAVPVDAGGPDAQTEDAGPPPDPNDPYAEVRQVCLDTINDYRAALGIAPLRRATAEVERCSDDGAKLDGDRNQAHYSANMCPGMGAQNTCPGWSVGGRSGTLADALKGCLQLMWDEDEPPQGRDACIEAYFNGDTDCFLAHGHYLNMSNADNTQVACGFYEMPDGRFWMNQDFGR